MRIIFFFFILSVAFTAKASTSITTSTVSGHWTLSGSPYLVYNNISVDGTAMLTIDPGVSVIFQGAYNLYVSGILYAAGTVTQPINFTVSDTTGWWDGTTATGGWHGIQFQPYTGTGTDTSKLANCHVSYTKFDSTDAVSYPTITTLFVQRGLNVSNCTFTNNKSGYDYLLYVLTYPGQAFNMDGCTFSNNNFSNPVIFLDNFWGGSCHISGNKVFNNQSGNVVILCASVNMLFEQNELYNNTSANGTISLVGTTSMTTTKDCHATIRGNKIHHNINTSDAALVCFGGFVDINANLICNNKHLSGLCGWVDGGGAINIGHNTPGPDDSTCYTVRNNVIANNYSPFHGGGINILDAKSVISNNQIINNSSALGGAIYVYNNFSTIIRNNVMYGNVTTSDSTSANSPDLEGAVLSTIAYDHNWTEHSTIFDLNIGSSYTLTGDTTTNVSGLNPGLVSPTITASVTEDALTANFGLLGSSNCINAGDTTGAVCYTLDYAGNGRISGTHIDIGAYEVNLTTLGTNNLLQVNTEVSLYPNPAGAFVTISSKEKINKISIINMAGRLVFNQTYDTDVVQVNLANLVSGVYFIRINNTDVKKFIKE